MGQDIETRNISQKNMLESYLTNLQKLSVLEKLSIQKSKRNTTDINLVSEKKNKTQTPHNLLGLKCKVTKL